MLTTYVDLLNKNNGPVDASSRGYKGNLTFFQQGRCTIWVDATAAGQFVTNEDSTVAHPSNPTVEEVPYSGVQFVALPEFTGMGTAVGRQFCNVLEGTATVEEALKNAQWVTEKQMMRTQMLNRE